MATLEEMFPVQHFRGSDLKEPTSEMKVEEITEEENYGKTEWFCWFDGEKRGVRLSFKNAERLALAAKSKNSKDWVGLWVRLSPKPFTNIKGEPGTAIELEVVPAPAQNGGPVGNGGGALPQSQEPHPQSPKPTAKPAPKADMDDEIPF